MCGGGGVGGVYMLYLPETDCLTQIDLTFQQQAEQRAPCNKTQPKDAWEAIRFTLCRSKNVVKHGIVVQSWLQSEANYHGQGGCIFGSNMLFCLLVCGFTGAVLSQRQVYTRSKENEHYE